MKNFIRIQLLLIEIAQDVIQAFFESKYQPNTFEGFLNLHKHVIYHLYHNKYKCCGCTPQTTLPRQRMILQPQFDKCFDARNGCQSPNNCSCKYNAKQNVSIEDIDISLCVTLVVNCFDTLLTQQQITSLCDIRKTRNDISHHTGKELDSVEFNKMWGQIARSAIILAKCIHPNYEVGIKKRIDRLNNRSFSDEETIEVLRHPVERNVQIEQELKDIKGGMLKIKASLKSEQEQPKSPNSTSLDQDDTTLKEVAERIRSSSSLDESERRYFQIYGQVENMRQQDRDDKYNTKYAVLVYICIYGSSVIENISSEILSKIVNAIGEELPPETVVSIVPDCLVELLANYFDNVDDTYTPRNEETTKAVISSFGTACPECFVEICNFDILCGNVVPSEIVHKLYAETEHNVFYVTIDIHIGERISRKDKM